MPVLVIWTEHEGENWPTSWFHGLCHPSCHREAYMKPSKSSEMSQKIANAGADARAENGRWRPRLLTAKSVPLPCGFRAASPRSRVATARFPSPIALWANYIESYIRNRAGNSAMYNGG